MPISQTEFENTYPNLLHISLARYREDDCLDGSRHRMDLVVDFNVQEKGPAEVMKKVFAPLMQEWESFSPKPSEFLVDG